MRYMALQRMVHMVQECASNGDQPPDIMLDLRNRNAIDLRASTDQLIQLCELSHTRKR